ncbi:MAG: rhomboid family intramembrane serine protease [Bacteroidaceae bacterium]|nr:rhomboid family intramembrane serine protease [Bacteroidaceae bacterium]
MNKLPPVTKNLLIINVLCWMGTLAMAKYGIDLQKLFGLHFFMAPGFRIWQLVTYQFLHEGFQHIFFNMFAVWMFGRIMEVQWGSKRFLIFYLLCGIGAGLTQELCQFIHYELVYAHYEVVALGNGITIPMRQYLDQILTVGASGSVYGILLGYGMTFPENRLIIFMPIPIPIKAKWLVVAYVILELLLGLRNSAADNVAHFAHLGGMLAGFLIMLYWKHKERKDNHIKFTW